MIKYALVCDNGHEFESWFQNSESFESQSRRGFVECPMCPSTRVRKAIMAPSVARTDRDIALTPAPTPAPAAAPVPVPTPPAPVALLDERQQAMRAMIRELHQKIVENTVDVGSKFPEEARRMHEGETPQRAIRGEATLDEARELIEEGVPLMPLPMLPDERN